MRTYSGSRRLHSEAGANAVEFALLAPIVFVLIFGGITGALAWNTQQTLTHAAREGARFGATLPAPEEDCFDGQGTAPTDWHDAVWTRTVESVVGIDTSDLEAEVCYVPGELDDEDEPIDPKVTVHVETPGQIMTVFFPNMDFQISADATARHEE